MSMEGTRHTSGLERPDGAWREIKRELCRACTLGVVVLEAGPTSASLGELTEAARACLRPTDLVIQLDPAHALVLLPEKETEAAVDTARCLLEAISPWAPQARAGLATAPHDGEEPEALLAAARAALLQAPDGGLCKSQSRKQQLMLGERPVVVADPSMLRTYALLRRLASSGLPVLLQGETGTGKEHAAWAVHHWSPRVNRPFLVLNCAALPESLAESELFGFERGAFSSADRPRAGLLESASGGTLFLDEVAELSLPVQAKLLRALESKRVIRLGDSRERPVDLRVVAATHRGLADEVKAGRFREDLFFRLAAAVVPLPPLRDRPCELPLLAHTFLEAACARNGRPVPRLSASVLAMLSAHTWPGNVRELKNAMEYAAAVASGPVLEPSALPDSLQGPESPANLPGPEDLPEPAVSLAPPAPLPFRSLMEEVRDLECRRILEALSATGGVQSRAAQLIGMPLRTFAFKLRQYKILRDAVARHRHGQGRKLHAS